MSMKPARKKDSVIMKPYKRWQIVESSGGKGEEGEGSGRVRKGWNERRQTVEGYGEGVMGVMVRG